MALEIPAYIPVIGPLVQGLDYDMATSEEVTHANEFTRHPIEDPSRSFINDHNREQPTEIRLTMQVSSVALGIEGAPNGVRRMMDLQDALLSLRAGQSTDTSKYFDVYTGIRAYRNMGIENLQFTRSENEPNVLIVNMSLIEFRFARAPRALSKVYLMDANDGPRNYANRTLVTDPDRPITEATRQQLEPRRGTLSEQDKGVLKTAIRQIPSQMKIRLGIKAGTVTGVFGI